MSFDDVLDQVRELLQSKGRVAYRALKLRFQLDDEYLEGIKDELIDAERVAVDEDGKVLVWVGSREEEKGKRIKDNGITGEQEGETGKRGNGETEKQGKGEAAKGGNGETGGVNLQPLAPSPQSPAAERRQLTVMFCDLVGSTALSEQLDPEELREVISAYQQTCTTVIQRYSGYLAQHLGDGLLVYFGYPVAHEDEAARAVRSGLEIVAALSKLNAHLQGLVGTQHVLPLQVRIGLHTGLVVIGEIGSSARRELLALGETPNIAARLQGLAEPDTVVMSAVTQRLVQGLFACQALGQQTLKGISTPLAVYRVLGESGVQSRFEVSVQKGLPPLVGREEELRVLQRRWAQAKEGSGQVVLLSGEPGIGKSRLVQALKEQVLTEGATRIEFRCSPYHQNSAFYPLIDHLQRLLQLQREDTPQTKLSKLQQGLAAYRFPQADTLPLLATLLSLPQPEGTSPLALSPQKQKQKTQEALVAWIMEEAERAAVYCAWEDLHWADPSTLEVLTLFLDQLPTARIFSVLTCRPEFTPPWSARSYLTSLTLTRLGRQQIEAMVANVSGGKALPAEVLHQIVDKTDGVPLFVEELTKMVIESGAAVGARPSTSSGAVPLQSLAIPPTLQDALMARLDRLGATKEVAQLGATIGREFSYDLLQAVSTVDETLLQQGLGKLVEAELIYQRGLPPQATYLFKHALIQDTAYQSLLKSRRQQLHQQIAQVMTERFLDIQENQPELLAHHYTEAGLIEQAIPYWQQAGQRASQRSANAEAIRHLTKGLELLMILPETPERVQQELTLQMALGTPLQATKGVAAPELGIAYTRARELCRQVGETPQLLPVLFGLCRFYGNRGDLQTLRELGEQFLRLAQRVEPTHLVGAHYMLGVSFYWPGEFASTRAHLEQSIALSNRRQHHSLAFVYGIDPGVSCLTYLAWTLWDLGYPDQARERMKEVLPLAQELSHPFSVAQALSAAASLHKLRREPQAVQERAEAMIALARSQGFPYWEGRGIIYRGWALAEQGQAEEGIDQIRQGLTAYQSAGAELGRTYWFACLAEAYKKKEQIAEGLNVLAEALTVVDTTGERRYEAELYRLKGELTLQKLSVVSHQLSVPDPRPLTPDPQGEAEACFLKAIKIAQRQQAKSLELRATTSLARLWQAQGKRLEARDKLAAIYNWFTEGFDTKDLQETKALIEELSH
ncbi:MAG: adenylate/guanylate cyclase domain-containing protein [Candidatus Binatia bacterium]